MKHLACIMDGNRRWAKQNGLASFQGHAEGFKAAKRVIAYCVKNKISYLSLYTFSLENFNRSAFEVDFIFNLLITSINKSLIADCIKQGVRVTFIGDRSLFPEKVKNHCDQLEQETQDGTNLNLNFLFCYGAQQEIIAGVKRLVSQAQQGLLNEEAVTEELFQENLWMGKIPSPDMIIRTGGSQRLSNFLLYQAAYSELYFFDCFWPEITDTHLDTALSSFKTSQRNFGT